MSHYADEIEDAHLESKSIQGGIDLPRFAHKLHALRKVAETEGLANVEFDALVNSMLPTLMDQVA